MTGAGFSIRFDQALRDDLRRRLRATRWSRAAVGGWERGTSAAFLRDLLAQWSGPYDFDAAERRLNAWPQQRVAFDGFGLHYLRLPGRGPNPRPLLLLNGWPSSFVEFGRLAPRLADPAAFGGSAEDAFEVVMPALPGFGYSDPPSAPGAPWAEQVFHRLMEGHLGHARYLVSGTDIGAGVARQLALAYPQAVQGIHIASVIDPPLAPDAVLTDDERAYRASAARWEAEEGAYEHVHYTRPQTLALGLADSPAGLASWIVEKFHAWSDHDGDLLRVFPAEMLLDTLMIYWATDSIGSSVGLYYDHAHFRPRAAAASRVEVPTALCAWPKDLVVAPREWAERAYNLVRYTRQPRGGHFPAWEAPEAYADDLRGFARQVKRGGA